MVLGSVFFAAFGFYCLCVVGNFVGMYLDDWTVGLFYSGSFLSGQFNFELVNIAGMVVL